MKLDFDLPFDRTGVALAVTEAGPASANVGERKLAVAVLLRALSDAPFAPEARAFLNGGQMLPFWCEIAGVSLEAVRQHWHRRRRRTRTPRRSSFSRQLGVNG